MLPRLIRYYPPRDGDAFPDDVLALAKLVPGVREAKDGSIEAPLNAAWLAERSLQQCGATYRTWTPREKAKKRPGSIQELVARGLLRAADSRTGISMEKFLAPYQVREPFRFADSTGVLFQWATGTGKSLGSQIWGLLDDGPIAVVTGAKGRLQWRDSVTRFTPLVPHVLSGTGFVGNVELLLHEVAKLEGRKFPPAVRAAFQQYLKLACSCGVAHRKEIFSKGRKLYLRVFLQAGHHDLTIGAGDRPAVQVPFDIEDPAIPKESRFIICSWETLPYHVDKILKAKPSSVILDESHRGKNHRRVEMIELGEQELRNEPKAKQIEDGRWVKYVDLENIVSATKKLTHAAKRRAALTATPIKDRPRDLWAQLDYLVPWGFGKYWDFARRYCAAVKNTWGGIDDRGTSNMEELTQRVAFHWSWVSAEESKASLPPMRREVIYLPPDAQQAEDGSFAEELAKVSKVNVHSITSIRLAAACSRKRKALTDQIVEDAAGGAKIVVFTARHHDVDVLKTVLKQRLPKNVRLFASDGRDSPDKRYEISSEYMALPSHAVLVGTGQAFGEQNDLNETDIVHVAMLPYTIAELIQEEGRFTRLGSTRRVLINYWIAEGTVDEKVAGILLSKLPAMETMKTEGTQGMRAAFVGNEEELIASLANDIIARATDAKVEGIAQ